MSKTQAIFSQFCQKHKPYLLDFVKITTDARIRRIPAPDIIVSFSANVNPLGVSPLLKRDLASKLDVTADKAGTQGGRQLVPG